MFPFARPLSLVLAAAVLLPGCASVGGAGVKPPAKPFVVRPSLKAGAVKVSFPGLKPATPLYRTLATRADIAAVGLTLIDARGHKQFRRLERAELWVPRVEVAFAQVSAGAIEFLVQAFDDEGRAIGEASQVDRVQANRTTVMKLAVKLTPAGGTGDVSAVIDFIDGDPVPVCGAEAFHRADRNQDRFLELAEYLAGYPFATCDEPVVGPMPEPPPVVVSPVVDTPVPVHTVRRLSAPFRPELPPGLAAFQALDVDQNGLLSLAEFLGWVLPPSDPCGDHFQALDVDGDGRLTFQEWRVSRPVPMLALEGVARLTPPADVLERQAFDAVDLDGDGHLDRDEHCGPVALPGLVNEG
ncbi:MAG: hypothetical protein VKQ33_01795 [Candidatus Sericytochromatia bacterium]|nr:hypothetical protein [Candidatus Sericytochromatia bacterium]